MSSNITLDEVTFLDILLDWIKVLGFPILCINLWIPWEWSGVFCQWYSCLFKRENGLCWFQYMVVDMTLKWMWDFIPCFLCQSPIVLLEHHSKVKLSLTVRSLIPLCVFHENLQFPIFLHAFPSPFLQGSEALSLAEEAAVSSSICRATILPPMPGDPGGITAVQPVRWALTNSHLLGPFLNC